MIISARLALDNFYFFFCEILFQTIVFIQNSINILNLKTSVKPILIIFTPNHLRKIKNIPNLYLYPNTNFKFSTYHFQLKNKYILENKYIINGYKKLYNFLCLRRIIPCWVTKQKMVQWHSNRNIISQWLHFQQNKGQPKY